MFIASRRVDPFAFASPGGGANAGALSSPSALGASPGGALTFAVTVGPLATGAVSCTGDLACWGVRLAL
jgi:hypothetical protein